MENIVIYGGLYIMLIACMIALCGAVKGWLLQRKMIDRAVVKKAVSKFTLPALVLIITGFILTGIGITLTLN